MWCVASEWWREGSVWCVASEWWREGSVWCVASEWWREGSVWCVASKWWRERLRCFWLWSSQITMDVLVDMDHDALKEIGVDAYGARHKILKKVKETSATAAHPGKH